MNAVLRGTGPVMILPRTGHMISQAVQYIGISLLPEIGILLYGKVKGYISASQNLPSTEFAGILRIEIMEISINPEKTYQIPP